MTTDGSKFCIQNMLHGITITDISKNKSVCFQQSLNLLAPNPLFPAQRHLGQFRGFSVTVTYTTSKQTLNCPIEHLEEEKFKVKHQNSIRSNAKAAQIFVGHNSKYIDVYSIATDRDSLVHQKKIS